MEEWLFFRACDGFIIIFPYLPGGLDDFVNKFVPELQRRGLFRHDYERKTLRENSVFRGRDNGRRRNAALGQARSDLRESPRHRSRDEQASSPVAPLHPRQLQTPPPTPAVFALPTPLTGNHQYCAAR
jgi:hypothetical protein